MIIRRMISRVISLAVAAFNFSAVFSWYPSFYRSLNSDAGASKGEYYVGMVIIQAFLAIPLVCIWFGDYLADLEWGDQRWRIPHWGRQSSLFPCPSLLLKFIAWILLLAPVSIILWSKIR